MKRLLICTAIATSLGLSGCGGGGDDLSTVEAEAVVEKPFARILFDPAAANLNVPNDFLMIPDTTSNSVFDFTIELEGDTFNPGDPTQALGVLDGWSTQHPFNITVNLPSNLDVDSTSASAPGAVRIFEATQALEGTSAVCQAIAAEAGAPGVPCEIGDELQNGVDFITVKSAPGTVTVLPLKPLKPGQGHILVVTSDLKDTDGRAVRGSSTWELAIQDINTLPLADAAQLQLQGLVNLIVAPVLQQGLQREDISYAAYFTTQSAGTVVNTIKQLQIGPFAQAFAAALAGGADQATAAATAGQFLPVILANESATADTAFDVLATTLLGEEGFAGLQAVGLDSCAAMLGVLADPTSPLFATASATFAQVGQFCAASVKEGSINLTHYLNPSAPLTDWWRSACTNGAMLSSLGAETVGSLLASGAAGPYNDLCQAASGGQLFDLNLAAIGIEDRRNLTRFAPIPAPSGSNADGTETLTVQITVPDETVIAILAGLSDAVEPVTKPATGWPVVVLQHGITSKKEDTLAISGALALAGFATVAIDHPLHGSRGYTIGEQTVNASNGFGGSPTDYLNLSSLITARDNIRQSIVDTMGLRLGLNAVVDLTGGAIDLDGTNVSFVGQSLGSITGIGTVATSNNTLGGDLAAFDSMFAFNSAVLSVPGQGIAGFLLESASFSPLIKGSLLAASSADFQAFLGAYAATNQLPLASAIAPAFLEFEAGLSDVQLAPINSTFASFAFAAQTVIDAGDPSNYAAQLGANTPVLMQIVVGGGTNDDGSTALGDQVIPNTTSLPLAGQEPLARNIGLSGVSSTTQGNGLVRFITGSHSSILNPSASLAATAEMQRQAAVFLQTEGATILVTDTSVVAN